MLEALAGSQSGELDRFVERCDADCDRRADAIAVAAQQPVQRQTGGQAQQVVERNVERGQGRGRSFGQRRQHGQCELGVQGVQIACTVGAAPAGAQDLFLRLAGQRRIEGRAAPGAAALLRIDADEHHRRALDLVLVEHAVGHAQVELDRYDFDVGDLHGNTSVQSSIPLIRDGVLSHGGGSINLPILGIRAKTDSSCGALRSERVRSRPG